MTKQDKSSTLLVGVANPATIPQLMGLAADLALETKSQIVVTNVVTVPGQIGLVSAKDSPMVRASSELLRKAIRAVADRKVKARGVVEVAREADAHRRYPPRRRAIRWGSRLAGNAARPARRRPVGSQGRPPQP